MVVSLRAQNSQIIGKIYVGVQLYGTDKYLCIYMYIYIYIRTYVYLPDHSINMPQIHSIKKHPQNHFINQNVYRMQSATV
jgi:hypothetical protein